MLNRTVHCCLFKLPAREWAARIAKAGVRANNLVATKWRLATRVTSGENGSGDYMQLATLCNWQLALATEMALATLALATEMNGAASAVVS